MGWVSDDACREALEEGLDEEPVIGDPSPDRAGFDLVGDPIGDEIERPDVRRVPQIVSIRKQGR